MRPMLVRPWRVVWIILALSLATTPSLTAQAQDATPGQSGNQTVLQLDGGKVQVGESIDLNLVLVKAPEGAQRFDISISLQDPTVAKITGIQGGIISGPFFQVVSQTERFIEFRAVDLDNRINPGGKDLVLATVKLTALKAGTTRFNVVVNTLVSDKGNNLAPSIKLGSLISVVSVTNPASTSSSTSAAGLVPIGSSTRSPRDLDGDGRYEDIDGDGQLTAKDVAIFAYNIDSNAIQSRQGLFDFNGDGRVDFADALKLASLIKLSPRNPQAIGLSLADHPTIGLESNQVTSQKDVGLKLILTDAPSGLQLYDITVVVGDGNIARIKGVASRSIDKLFFEVVHQTDNSIEFRAADLKNEVPAGARNLPLAAITLTGVKPGETAIYVVANLIINDQGKKVQPLTNSGSLTVTAFTIGESAAPPRDLDGDGLFEDINGDGKLTFADVRIFAFNLSSPAVQENWQMFDFNGDGKVDFSDAVTLTNLIEYALQSSSR